MTSKAKTVVLAAGSILAIAAAGASIRYVVSKPDVSIPFHEGVGQIMAQLTAERLGKHGQIVVVTLDPHEFPILKAQLDGFKKGLRQRGGFRIVDTVVIRAVGQSDYGVGHGLSSEEFLRIHSQHGNVGALISFVGVPNLKSEEIHKLRASKLIFVAEAKFGPHLRKLLDHRVVQAAIVPRFLPPEPGAKEHLDTPRDRFDRYFQILKAPPAPVLASESANSAR